MAGVNSFEQEAMRRAQEMHRVPQQSGSYNSNHAPFSQGGGQFSPFNRQQRTNEQVHNQHNEEHHNNHQEEQHHHDSSPASPNNESCVESSLEKQSEKNIFDILLEDKDKSLVLILILLLSSEGADTSLILALMFLII